MQNRRMVVKSIEVIVSSKEGQRFEKIEGFHLEKDIHEHEWCILMNYPHITYQEITGFGGAFTQSSAINFYKMNDVKQRELLEAYFGETGLRYNVGRTHIASCDFSLGKFGYTEKEDLSDFNVKCDEDLLIPFIQSCQKYTKEKITLLASPWSPPAWMKSNNDVLHGGRLLEKYYQTYAEYFVKYIQAYQLKGIAVDMVTIQNEPRANQTWESCIFTAQEEKIFLRDYLYPTLEKNGLETQVKIVIWDQNKDRVFERVSEILSDEKVRKMVHGIGIHWYTGHHFENLKLCKEFYPEKEIIFTEGCLEYIPGVYRTETGKFAITCDTPWDLGAKYARDMIGNYANGQSMMMDWNMILDAAGGPNHVNNFCAAPVMVDTENQEIIYESSYYFIGHFSRYVPNGSKRIASSCYTRDLETVSFITPENRVVTVILNIHDTDITFTLKDVKEKSVCEIIAKKKSIMTLIYS